jgi:hypothetical protein
MCVDLDDTDTIQNGRTPWFPLETVLEAWLDMIEQGRRRRKAMDARSLQSQNPARYRRPF